MSAEVHRQEFIRNRQGTRLGLQCYPVAGERTAVAILAHGTFSNHRSCRGLARHLAAHGVESWILDFQGHGVSDRPSSEPDFETMCLDDAGAALDFIDRVRPGMPVCWVGHSGGGLAILMLLARHRAYRERVSRIVTLASQATDAAIASRNRLAIRAASGATRVLAFAPGKLFKLGPENEFGRVMRQWYGWSLSGRWSGTDGFDYEQGLSELTAPCLMLAASADTFIAPVSGCRRLFESYGSPDKRFQLCGVDTGFIENYSHARLISSRSAARDVWPLVADWCLDSAGSELLWTGQSRTRNPLVRPPR